MSNPIQVPPETNSHLALNHLQQFKWFYYAMVLLIFIIIRVNAWSNVSVLEDHDSAHYLRIIKTFQSLDLDKIWNLSPDDTFFYPIFETIFAMPGWSYEFSGRLTSFVFAIGIFILIILIGEKISNVEAVLISLLFFTFNPFFIPFSFGVLTEPSYIATIYLGLYLYLKKYRNPSVMNAIILGFVFALGFLNRTEGILFIAIVPGIQLIHFLFFRNGEYNFSKYLSWSLTYIFIFSLLASPQIYRVSDKIGTFALNGRQVWMAMLKNPDGKSYEEKKHGLDYSPKQINLTYLQTHPEAYKKLESSGDVKNIIKLFMDEVSKLQQFQLSSLLGAFVLIFFGIGLISLFNQKLFFEVTLILLLIIVSLVPSAMHDVDFRHIAIIAPIMILVAGIGVVFLSNEITNNISSQKLANFLKGKLSFVLLLVSILTSFSSLNSAVKNPTKNDEYVPKDYYKPIEIIRENIKKNSLINPILVSRKSYFAYMSNLPPLEIAFTDYDGLLKYCDLNNISYLFLDYKNIKDYPFLSRFEKGNTPHFEKIYSGTDSFGFKIELYKFLNIHVF